jgi:hypothetical protein
VGAGSSVPIAERASSGPFDGLEEQTAIVAFEFGACEVDADCAALSCGGAVCGPLEDEPAVCAMSRVGECLSNVPSSSCACVEGACRWSRHAPVLLCATMDDPPAGNRGFRNPGRLEEYPLRLSD